MKKLALLFSLLSLSSVIFPASGAQLAPVAAATAAAPTRYTLLLMGNKAGFETSAQDPDGSLQLYFEFSDRGRGPKVTEHITLNKDSLPVELTNTGNDYLKAPVDERFSLNQGKASWKNRAEEGEKQISDRAFYVSISGVPEENAILARALLAAGGRLPLLPEGEASIEKRGQLMVSANGQSRTVVQYAINGLDFTPTPIWLDQGGKFFATVSGSWFAVVPEGWESSVEALAKAQDDIDNQRAANLAKTLAHKPTGSLAFVHANLFDSATASVHPNTSIVISGNKI